jgi:hypothetical protein
VNYVNTPSKLDAYHLNFGRMIDDRDFVFSIGGLL